MRVSFDLPDWAVGKDINIFSGRELVGKLEYHYEKKKQKDGKLSRKKYYSPIKLKPADGRCNGCGDCCSTGGSPFSRDILNQIRWRLDDYEWQGTGTKCPLLAEDGCVMKGSIPFSCAKSNCEGWSENCTEKLVPVDNNSIILDVV
jgi:hypothetical protein